MKQSFLSNFRQFRKWYKILEVIRLLNPAHNCLLSMTCRTLFIRNCYAFSKLIDVYSKLCNVHYMSCDAYSIPYNVYSISCDTYSILYFVMHIRYLVMYILWPCDVYSILRDAYSIICWCIVFLVMHILYI